MALIHLRAQSAFRFTAGTVSIALNSFSRSAVSLNYRRDKKEDQEDIIKAYRTDCISFAGPGYLIRIPDLDFPNRIPDQDPQH